MIKRFGFFAFAVLTMGAGHALASDLPPGMVVRQGTATVTLADIDAFAARMPPDQRAGYFSSGKRLETTLRSILLEKQVAEEARKLGIDKDPAVQQQVQLAIDTTLMTARVNALRESVVVPDLTDLAQERYNADKASFILTGVLDVKHVLIQTEKHSDEEARRIAEQVRLKAVADPDSFDALVTEYSEDPSHSTNGGLMRNAGSSETYVAEFAEAARALKKAKEVSPLVKTKFGYHVLVLVNRTTDRQRTFAEVKDQMLTELRAEYVKKYVADYVSGMQNNPVDSNAELVNSLRTRYGDVSAALEGNEETGQPQPGAPAVSKP